MQRDLRDTALFGELTAVAESWFLPGTQRVCDAAEPVVSPDGRQIAFTGTLLPALDGPAVTRIVLLDMHDGSLRVVADGGGSDRSPRWSRDGAQIFFLSDRDEPGRQQVYSFALSTGAVTALTCPRGSVESVQVGPDGRRLLLVVAEPGADLAGAQGGISQAVSAPSLPAWMPSVETAGEPHGWRGAWSLDLVTGLLRRISAGGTNVWEAGWCGNDAIAAIASDEPTEEAWYAATARRIDLEGSEQVLYRTDVQLGWIAASPTGENIAFAEAICSDRMILAGDLRIVDAAGRVHRPDTRNVDVCWLGWLDRERLLFGGLRGLETVVGLFTLGAGTTELWVALDRTIGSRFGIDLAPVPGPKPAFVAAAQGFSQAPAIVRWDGTLTEVHRFALDAHDAALPAFRAEALEWTAPDGLEIQGWLLRPETAHPHPLILEIHGGPIGAHRPRYLGTNWNWVALLRRGYALLLPNPRGSSGRGQAFAERVVGDMGGADMQDYLSGIDHLVASGIADPQRLGVMGVSYGGFMTSWLITQDSRFRAAVSVAPVTNWVSEHLTSHIGDFCRRFLGESMNVLGSRYFTRSPVLFAAQARTPTLNICGALDRNTPPGQAMEFHYALKEHGTESVLVTYPREGHAIRGFPAVFDYGARVVDWFERKLPG
jgi:dipeptidyl aminopeptidase/acylaminoacyl peptidase